MYHIIVCLGINISLFLWRPFASYSKHFFFSVPGQAPGQVLARALSPTSISVGWNQLQEIERNGIITNYEVKYSNSDGLTTLQATGTGTVLSIGLMDLAIAENYSIQVRAYTSVGPGPYSDTITVMTPESGMNELH